MGPADTTGDAPATATSEEEPTTTATATAITAATTTATTGATTGATTDAASVCGDGVVDPGEACDDGDGDDGDACTNACTLAECGDAIVGPGEACDEGADNGPGRPCSETCQTTAAMCGDGQIGPGEQCDDGPDNADTNSCTAGCAHNICGDGKVGPGEGCDDGNAIDDDACSNACALTSCGDNVLAPTEQCDDGNADNTDACTAACTQATCSDGFVQPGVGEQCDDGPDNADDAMCTTACQAAVCGDGHVWAAGGEACDSGAENGPGKACNAGCQLNVCGDGDPGPDEACDDGNAVDGDGCTAACQLGQQVLQVVMGDYHSCGLFSGGVVKCWGHNHEGVLGHHVLGSIGDVPGEVSPALPPVDLGTGVKALSLAAGFFHTCAVVTGNLVKCWGDGGFGALGLGDSQDRGDDPNEMGDFLPYVSLGAGVQVSAVTAAEHHTCALLTDGGVKCWGFGGARLGLGDNMTRGTAGIHMGDNLPRVDLGTGKKAVSISASTTHTCVLLDDSTIKCWGAGPYLGLEDGASHGGQPGQMGDNLPAVKLGVGKVPVDVTAGDTHTCALLAGGLIKCWGLLSAGNNVGNSPGEMGDFLPVVNLGQGKFVRKVVASKTMTCVNLTDDGVKCWGYGFLGFTGQDVGDVPAEMGDALPLVNLGTGQSAKDIFSQRWVTCVRLAAGGVKCWGYNKFAQLGLGDTVDRGHTNESMGDNLPLVDL